MIQELVTIQDVITDPNLFGDRFQGPSWKNWRVFLKALFGLGLDAEESKIFQKFTEREIQPEEVSEAWLVVGRRGGKSLISALVAVYLSCFRDYGECLAPGERATVMVIAADRRQARVVFRYIAGLLEECSMLLALVERRTAETIDLTNGATIEVHTASFRSTRGYTIAAAVCDEIAFWRSDLSANPDTEILGALRPGMTTIPGSLLLCISSPYSRRGELWKNFKEYYGKEDPAVLVWKGTSQEMNPTLPDRVVQHALERDASAARAEFLAEFRSDLETFVSSEAVDACVKPGRFELPYRSDFRYTAGVDPSGGGPDEFALSVCHKEGERIVQDCIRGWRSQRPADVVAEACRVLESYRIKTVYGDRYSGEWVKQAFRDNGVEYRYADLSASDAFLELLPLLNQGTIDLLDDKRQTAQLIALERRRGRIGKDTVSHPAGGHDDLINSLAIAVHNVKCEILQAFCFV